MSDVLPISVVVPAYNAETTLASAFAQTSRPMEIIVVDDGSNDRTAEVAGRAGARVIRTPNGGVAHARNVGIRAARGEWVALLDADDRWHPEKLATQWSAHELRPDVGLILTDFDFVAADGTRAAGGGLLTNPGYHRSRPKVIAPGVELIAGDAAALGLCYGYFMLPSTLVFRRENAVDREVLFLPREQTASGDFHTFPEDSEWCLRFCGSSDVLVVRRRLVDYCTSEFGLSAHPGRVRFGDVILMDRIVSHPGVYALGAAAIARKRRSALARSAATIYVRRLEIDAACAVARHAWRTSRAPLDGLLLALVGSMRNVYLRKMLALIRALWRDRVKNVVIARGKLT